MLARACSVCLIAALSAAAAHAAEPVALFDGKSLKGWVQQGGKAKYEVVGGTIVGTSVPNTPNSFLCTKRDYGDFELTLEVKVDDGLNSGIQFRSLCFDHPTRWTDDAGKEHTIPAGRVHGYQMEIDPSDRAYSGGVYDEARRAWLADLSDNPEGRAAFKRGEWNKYRLRCEGPSIKTWVNGVPTAELTDDCTPRGFIALQVHQVGKEDVGKKVRWRNIQIKELE